MRGLLGVAALATSRLSFLSSCTTPSPAAGLEDIEDDVETIRAIGEWFNALEDAIPSISELRLRAIGRLRAAGWSCDRITVATGLSKTRRGALEGGAA